LDQLPRNVAVTAETTRTGVVFARHGSRVEAGVREVPVRRSERTSSESKAASGAGSR